MKNRVFIGLLCISMCLVGCAKDDPEETVSETTEVVAASDTEATTSETSEMTTEESSEESTSETTEPIVIDYNDLLKGYDTFELTSDDLIDGAWNGAISNTDSGENLSPSVSWEPVEGADHYLIYMIDIDASFWMHWKADGVTETTLPQGWAASDYVGPYPPTGSEHTYDIYVVALRGEPESVLGLVDAQSPRFPEIIRALDISVDGSTGNIISYGHLSGTFIND